MPCNPDHNRAPQKGKPPTASFSERPFFGSLFVGAERMTAGRLFLSCFSVRMSKWGFPKIRGTLLGVPIIRIIVFGGLYWGPLILGNYQVAQHGGTVEYTDWGHWGRCWGPILAHVGKLLPQRKVSVPGSDLADPWN